MPATVSPAIQPKRVKVGDKNGESKRYADRDIIKYCKNGQRKIVPAT
jgi:hypothetical protein